MQLKDVYVIMYAAFPCLVVEKGQIQWPFIH